MTVFLLSFGWSSLEPVHFVSVINLAEKDETKPDFEGVFLDLEQPKRRAFAPRPNPGHRPGTRQGPSPVD